MDVALHHYQQALRSVQSAIETGTLRRLAQQQSLNSPRLVEHMRHFDALMNEKSDVLRAHPSGLETIEFMAQESHLDAEVASWVEFMMQRYQTPEGLDNVLVLLPCSDRKPYRLSKSHRKFIDAIGSNACHEVMVTSPLGLVPRDLEDVWPAGFYDIPVTGDWTQDERDRVQSMVESFVKRHNYSFIVTIVASCSKLKESRLSKRVKVNPLVHEEHCNVLPMQFSIASKRLSYVVEKVSQSIWIDSRAYRGIFTATMHG